jgi:hypothetical protein
MDAGTFVRTYYDALRAGEPLAPFFADGPDVVKVGISERLVGGEAVAAGLREQTASTDDWTLESQDLRVVDRGDWGYFADRALMAWTRDGERRRFESRWSGAMERERVEPGGDRDGSADGGGGGDGADGDPDWRFVGMHVSAARPL